MNLSEISTYLLNEFNYSQYEDYSLNGLQVEASQSVLKIGAAVDFSSSTAEKALKEKVDLMITHHGLLWGKTDRISGVFGEKIKFLLLNKINLIGIHLPLDAHPTFGNNALIARDLLKLQNLEPAIEHGGNKIGYKGLNSQQTSLSAMADLFKAIPGALTSPLSLNFGPRVPEKICVVSGSAADSLYLFEKEGFDTLITGEPKQFAYHFCKENKLNAIFAGHYATETFGVRAISEHLSKRFNLDWVFIDEPTGI